MNLKDHIRSIKDYPKKGILFRDITTLIKNEKAFTKCIDEIVERTKKFKFEKQYSEKEVNQIIKNHHSFNDVPLLRRELISRLFLNRKDDGSVYWKK